MSVLTSTREPASDTRAVHGLLAGHRWPVVIVAGLLMGVSWQPFNLWPAALVAIPAFTLAVRGVRARRAFGLGYLFGLAMLTVTISWVHVLGVPVAALLSTFEALFFGLLGVALMLVGRLRWWPLAAACCWVLCEFGYARIPFGGFGWSRIGYTMVDTPLSGFFPFLGVAGVGFLLALIAHLIAWTCLQLIGNRRWIRALAPTAAGLILLPGLGYAASFYQPEPAGGTHGSVKVGIVQGNVPGRGIEALGRARTVTNNHLSETINLITKARLGLVDQPDFILWPENSTDIDPLRDAQTRQVVQSATSLAGVPILVGAVMEGPGPDERQTSALWWDPQRGVLARYDKRNLVPFGEYIPFRDQLLPLIPILRQVGAQSVPGTEPGVLKVSLPDGRRIAVGDVICFELAYDRTIAETITNGAQLMMVQSNNATYGGTGQIAQQFAITRARAMETRREIAVATTDSVSGFIDRNGKVVNRTSEFTAASMTVTMPLRTAVTPAIRFGGWLDVGLALLAVAALVVAAAGQRGFGPQGFGRVREDGRGRSAADTGREKAAQ